MRLPRNISRSGPAESSRRAFLCIGRVLATCDDDNIGSIKTIEKCGGILEDVVSGPDLPKPKRRYWIQAGQDINLVQRHGATTGV